MPRALDPNELQVDYAAELVEMLLAGRLSLAYPSELDEYIALRENNKGALLKYAGWDETQAYRIAPMAPRISQAFADYQWGSDPTTTANVEQDQDLLDDIIRENDLGDEMHYFETIRSSEGQAWWRIYVDTLQLDVPIIEWHSRTEVIPYFRGKRLLAVAFVDVIRDEWVDGRESHTREVYRRLEVYGPGVVRNMVFKSDSVDKLGEQIPLENRVETEGYVEEWVHGLPMLAGVISNGRGRKGTVGRSDYHGVRDLLYDLNEAHSVDRANFRLAGKKRAVMPEKYRNPDGSAKDADVYFAESEDEMETDNTFKLLEYTYDGASSIARKQDLSSTILSLVGLARQLVDPNTGEGGAASGVALRTRLIPMVATVQGKSRATKQEVPVILSLMQQVDALDEGRGGFGRAWNSPGELPALELGTILPEDPQETLDYHVIAVNADLESLETGIQELHPDWEPDRVKEEIDRIISENSRIAGFPTEGGDEEVVDDTEPTEDEEPVELTESEFETQFGSGETG